MPAIFFQISALLAGILLSVQAGLNGKLRAGIGSPVVAAIVSFLVGLVFLVIAMLVRRDTLPTFKTLAGIPPHLYIGGLLGAIYVASATVLFPRLGALQTTGLVVAGQMVASLLIDHYGILGVATQPLNIYRIMSAVLLLGGVLLSGYQPK
jgi:transporter family-2 protein